MLRSLTLGVAPSCAVACGKEEVSPTAPSPRTPPPSPPSTYTLRASGTVVEIQGGPVADASVILARCGAPPPEGNILARTHGCKRQI